MMSKFLSTARPGALAMVLAAAFCVAAPLEGRAQDAPLAPGGVTGSQDFIPYAPPGGGTAPGLDPLSPPSAPMNLQDPNATPAPGTTDPGVPAPAPAPESAPERPRATPVRNSADTPVREGATTITSRHFSRDPARGRSIFEGKVIVNSKKFQVVADRVEISFDVRNPERITGMRCTGNVFVRQPESNSWADKLDYDMVGKIAILTGNAVVKEAARTISAKVIHLDTETGRSIISGNRQTIVLDMKGVDPSTKNKPLLKNGTIKSGDSGKPAAP